MEEHVASTETLEEPRIELPTRDLTPLTPEQRREAGLKTPDAQRADLVTSREFHSAGAAEVIEGEVVVRGEVQSGVIDESHIRHDHHGRRIHNRGR